MQDHRYRASACLFVRLCKYLFCLPWRDAQTRLARAVINHQDGDSNLWTVTHPSTKQERRRVTASINTNILPLCQTATYQCDKNYLLLATTMKPTLSHASSDVCKATQMIKIKEISCNHIRVHTPRYIHTYVAFSYISLYFRIICRFLSLILYELSGLRLPTSNRHSQN